ncbi:glycoside hydrolase [Lindgomyces ingoldianus]|uniref:Glycoside hydrolase n=1 Tax=Lindgomyces ingoldianus TaxID=673940 RepID=A0ACB6QWY8_9PLEO|nr:glycoside hydrolase [Lindgomyces ingoldianus]KAF2471559.1 glycoside hydrolase [Lindgomyces ingoldianus]
MQLPSCRCLIWIILTLLASTLISADGIALSNASLLWGPYRPNLYLGIRPRVPESLLMGLMWGRLGDRASKLRHTCEQNERMDGYDWTAYDTRKGGTQTIRDAENMVDITTEFVKKYEGQTAGNWALRVRGTPRDVATAGLRTSVVFYVAMEKMDTCPECRLEAATEKKGSGDDLTVEAVDIHVKHPGLGASVIHITGLKSTERADRPNNTGTHENTFVNSMNTTEDMLWQSKSLFQAVLQENRETRGNDAVNWYLPDSPGAGNVHFVQLVFQDDFEFDIIYSSQAASRSMTSPELTKEVKNNFQSFQSRFSAVFNPNTPFGSESHTVFSQTLLSNLLGGLGYFYGDSLVDDSHAPEYEETAPNFWEKIAESRVRAKHSSKGSFELFSHVPSRPFFPRGFLWGEGFHLLLVLDWDLDLALEVVRSWLALMDKDGWIAREQILGPEARSKVPKEFQVQMPQTANPPTLFWIVSRFIDMLSGKTKYVGHESVYLSQPDSGKALLTELYPLLQRHYAWFRRTQSGNIEEHSIPQASLNEGYRWRGRTPEHNLASGMDDYPRAEPPNPTELHLDALCWVGVMASVLLQLAEYTAQSPEEITTFSTQLAAISQNIDALHWSEEQQTYCDTQVWEDHHAYTCVQGYLSLFPFLTSFLGPTHPKLNATLNLIRDSSPEGLWTPYGLRGLKPSSTRYGTGDNYWRGPIWLNINYLAISRLLELATTPGPLQHRCRTIYTELRRNVVETVHSSWRTTGFAWEQYNPETGDGQQTQHFTGWTALVVKIMAFADLEDKEEGVGRFGGWVKDAREGAGWGKGGGVAGVVVLMLGGLVVTRRRIAALFRGGWRQVRGL